MLPIPQITGPQLDRTHPTQPLYGDDTLDWRCYAVLFPYSASSRGSSFCNCTGNTFAQQGFSSASDHLVIYEAKMSVGHACRIH
jgi:hypothetical protein